MLPLLFPGKNHEGYSLATRRCSLSAFLIQILSINRRERGLESAVFVFASCPVFNHRTGGFDDIFLQKNADGNLVSGLWIIGAWHFFAVMERCSLKQRGGGVA